MDTIRALLASESTCCRVATAHDPVLNSECCYTFHTPYTTSNGIVVNLNTFVGTIDDMAMGGEGDNDKQSLFVRIVKERVEKKQDEEDEAREAEAPKASAPTKLGIGIEGGFQSEQDKYDTVSKYSVVVMKSSQDKPSVVVELPYNDETKMTFPEMIIQSVDSIINHAGITVQQDVQVWQLDSGEDNVPVSKYAATLPFVENGVTISPDPHEWKCEKSGDTTNLWLNLSTGYIGGGRQNWDGSGGSNGALDHYNNTGKFYPLVVKLGTITSDITTADCYSYADDEDGPVRIPNLQELLEKRGIKITSSMQKTVKSTAELEVELNANYAFDAITESGSELEPVSGPGLQGLQNLGNSCYMNSVLQLLLSGTVPELAKRYGISPTSSLTDRPFLTAVKPQQAQQNLLAQTTKVASALTSGVFAKPIVAADADASDGNNSSSSTDPKYRLAPRMFKHLIGKDHVDFRTGQQQDAPQFLQYLLEQLDRAEKSQPQLLQQQQLNKTGGDNSNANDDDNNNTVHVSSHLFSFQTKHRLTCSADQKIKYKDGAPETVWSLRIPMDKAKVITDEMDTTETTEAKEGDDEEMKSPDQKRQKSDDEKDDDCKKKQVPTISFYTCVDEWAKETTVDDMKWSHLQNARHPAVEKLGLATCPRYLLVQMQRYELGPDWVPIKLEVNLNIPEEIDMEPYRSTGPKDGEDLVPPDADDNSGDAGAAAPSAAASSQPPPTATIDENALSQLMDMGFSINSCKRALKASGGSNVEAAMNWVFEHNTDPDFNDPLPEEEEAGSGAASSSSAAGGSGGGDSVDEAVVQSLVDTLGCFTSDQVRAALKATSGAADRAADWLFSHMDDLDGAIAALQSSQIGDDSGGGSSAAATTPSVPLDDGPGKYAMVGMISHIGKNTGSGHYVAHLKKDGKWVIFNDEKVALSSHPPVEHAYIYLFQRKDTIGMPGPNY